MSQFVLTGPAEDYQGRKVMRESLVAVMTGLGHFVLQHIDEKCILVASRDDTIKARGAKNMGCEVWAYSKLYGWLEEQNGGALAFPKAKASWVDWNLKNRSGPQRVKTAASGGVWHEPIPEPAMPEDPYDQSTAAMHM